ncbi:DUF2407 C-terminal domain-containing protein [Hypoxylon fragiforme]|uniref:DUF2407 C-terminal domain-containing protein n=1 Tax=Hypoxylon fragiforme TaxID=63214 RepID=UPI0020C68710|nr:DUF2407 C-terminal domain-containing protein [Hypoxylon fragiforme]KAI2611232.1 DUF2407 C-terminal domain-containing protein [Hypoxylon fragiforme]
MTTTSPPSSLKPPIITSSSSPLLSPLPSPTTPLPPPLLLTIRFSAAIPDLELDIPRPSSTTVVSLKHLIRARLSEPNSQRRLRFIHGGKILPDTAVLSSVLRPPPPPPPSARDSNAGYIYSNAASKGGAQPKGDGAHESNSSGKGKSIPGRPDPSLRIYVNCSIGDSLTSSELDAEATAASLPPPLATSTTTTTTGSQVGGEATSPLLPSPLPPNTPSTSATPRGFDRLLSAGFTPAEVNQLRLQFRSIHAPRYTPDTLPSPDSFRRMEDGWIDDNNSNPTNPNPNTSALNSGGGNGTDSDDVGLVALVDVMIRGVITGFVWPLGSAGWLIREEGMASGRWRFMVGVGVWFSVLIGIIRGISGEK